MKAKHHFGIFAILFIALGTYLDQVTLPNQQIVIQFSDTNISKAASDSTIEDIQNRLKHLGVKSIQIRQTDQGELKITYYSNSNVDYIKQFLSKDIGYELALESSNTQRTNQNNGTNDKDYLLAISEIQNSTDVSLDFEGLQAVELNYKRDRSYNPGSQSSIHIVHSKQTNKGIEVEIHVNKAVALAIEDVDYKIPAVRAGPAFIGKVNI